MNLLAYNDGLLYNAFQPTLSIVKNDSSCILSSLCYFDKIKYGEIISDCFIFINSHIFKINVSFDEFFYESLKTISAKYNIPLVIIFNLELKDLMRLMHFPQVSYNYLYRYECKIDKFHLKSNFGRKYRKACSYFLIKTKNLSLNDYKEGIELYNLVKYADSNLENINHNRLAEYYQKSEYAINLFCYFEGILVGMMLGFVYSNTAFMHIFFYNPNYLKYYLSDFLYQSFLYETKKLGVNSIVWGDASYDEQGLNNFKKHYSTNISKAYYCVYNSLQ